MIVNRHSQNEQTPTMTVYIRSAKDGIPFTTVQAASSRVGLSKAQPPASNERMVKIDMKDKQSTNILEQLIAQVGAVPLRPTPEDTTEWQSLEELRKESNASRDRMNAIKAEKQREATMLERARAAGGATEEAHKREHGFLYHYCSLYHLSSLKQGVHISRWQKAAGVFNLCLLYCYLLSKQRVCSKGGSVASSFSSGYLRPNPSLSFTALQRTYSSFCLVR